MFDAVSVVATLAPGVRDERMDRVDGRPAGTARWEGQAAVDEAVTVGRAAALDRYAADERYPRRPVGRRATKSSGSGCEMDFELR